MKKHEQSVCVWECHPLDLVPFPTKWFRVLHFVVYCVSMYETLYLQGGEAVFRSDILLQV